MGRGTVCGIQGRKKFQKSSCSPEDKSCHCVSFNFFRLWSCKRSNRVRTWMVDFEWNPRQGIVTQRWCGTHHAMFSLRRYHGVSEKYICIYILLYCQNVNGPAPDLEVKLRSDQSSSWKTAGHFLAKADTYSLSSNFSCSADSQYGFCQFSASSSKRWRSYFPVLQNCTDLFECVV